MAQWIDNLKLWFEDLKAEFILNFVKEERWRFLTDGLVVTLQLTLFALLLGIAIGVLVAIIRSTHDKTIATMRRGLGSLLLKFLNAICNIYLTVIRGTPVVLQLLIMFFVIFGSSNNKILAATLAFGINSGAYVAEIFRSGIMSINQGQSEAGRSLGFSYVQTMLYIVVPQAFKNVLPALLNEFITLLKETSVAGYIALQDLTKGADIIRGRTFSAFMPLIAAGLIYLVMVMILSWLGGKLERRLRNSER